MDSILTSPGVHLVKAQAGGIMDCLRLGMGRRTLAMLFRLHRQRSICTITPDHELAVEWLNTTLPILFRGLKWWTYQAWSRRSGQQRRVAMAMGRHLVLAWLLVKYNQMLQTG